MATTATAGDVLALHGSGRRQLLIGGTWADAASGGTLASIDPSTGQQIAEIAAGGVEDIDRAVAAARMALDGPWRRFTPVQRQNLLLRFADLVETHAAELGLLEVVDMGIPVSIGASRMRTPAEFAAHPQLAARDRWRTVQTANGPVQAMLPPFTFTDQEAVMGDVPSLGQHTDMILQEIGFNPERIAAMRAAGAI